MVLKAGRPEQPVDRLGLTDPRDLSTERKNARQRARAPVFPHGVNPPESRPGAPVTGRITSPRPARAPVTAPRLGWWTPSRSGCSDFDETVAVSPHPSPSETFPR